MDSTSTVGFIGLGAMGSRLARRLLEGNRVVGTNRTAGKAKDLIDLGMAWRDTPRAVASDADVIFSMVTDDDALAAITDGPDGLLAGLAPGKVYIDMSTVSPRASRELADRVSALGASMLDAPVSGSVPAAEDGSLTIMVGGPEETFRGVEPLLQQLGQSITHVGGHGQALVLKLAVNISLGAQMLAFSEGLLFAARGGIDPAVAARVMSGSPIGSPMLQARMPLVLDLPERAWFDVALLHKDLRLVVDTAAELNVPVPTATATVRELSLAEQFGYAHRDIAALYEVLAMSSTAAR
jgi:3-hydroxyisobutyrate dehydrogenase-like beta-hydroxyacid dehydrogenase